MPEEGAGLRAVFGRASAAIDPGLMAYGGIVVAFAEPEAWLPWLSEAMALLAPTEADRLARLKFAADRDARAITYALHRLLLCSMTDQDPASVSLVRDKNGCPHVVGDRIHTSLSHTDGGIAVAVSAAGPVGVDIEPAARAVAMTEIAARVCHPLESAALARLPNPGYEAALLALWVRKESLLKAAGIGLALEMNQFAEPHGWAQTDNTPVQAWMLDAGDSWVAAIAARPGATVSTHWLRPDASQAC